MRKGGKQVCDLWLLCGVKVAGRQSNFRTPNHKGVCANLDDEIWPDKKYPVTPQRKTLNTDILFWYFQTVGCRLYTGRPVAYFEMTRKQSSSKVKVRGHSETPSWKITIDFLAGEVGGEFLSLFRVWWSSSKYDRSTTGRYGWQLKSSHMYMHSARSMLRWLIAAACPLK
jgi:hypothetical protein